MYKSHEASYFYVTEFEIWDGFWLDYSTENFFWGCFLCFHGPNKYKIRVSVHCSVHSKTLISIKKKPVFFLGQNSLKHILNYGLHKCLICSSPRDLYIRTLFMVFTCVVTSKPCSHSFFSVKSQSVFPCSHLLNTFYCITLVLLG